MWLESKSAIRGRTAETAQVLQAATASTELGGGSQAATVSSCSAILICLAFGTWALRSVLSMSMMTLHTLQDAKEIVHAVFCKEFTLGFVADGVVKIVCYSNALRDSTFCMASVSVPYCLWM